MTCYNEQRFLGRALRMAARNAKTVPALRHRLRPSSSGRNGWNGNYHKYISQNSILLSWKTQYICAEFQDHSTARSTCLFAGSAHLLQSAGIARLSGSWNPSTEAPNRPIKRRRIRSGIITMLLRPCVAFQLLPVSIFIAVLEKVAQQTICRVLSSPACLYIIIADSLQIKGHVTP